MLPRESRGENISEILTRSVSRCLRINHFYICEIPIKACFFSAIIPAITLKFTWKRRERAAEPHARVPLFTKQHPALVGKRCSSRQLAPWQAAAYCRPDQNTSECRSVGRDTTAWPRRGVPESERECGRPACGVWGNGTLTSPQLLKSLSIRANCGDRTRKIAPNEKCGFNEPIPETKEKRVDYVTIQDMHYS